MAEVEVLLPSPALVDASTIIDSLRFARRSFRPFDSRVVDFVSDLSKELRNDPSCRSVPVIAALAFWIRPANLRRLEEEWRVLAERNVDVRLGPRGVVFHLPPTNVDTLFVYSWLMAALVGNANAVRISASSGTETPLVLDVVERVLHRHPEVADTVSFVRYGHEEEITAELSRADVRVIWGGDSTIRSVRAVPMNSHGTELAFADRFSMAAFNAASVEDLDEESIIELARKFFNDAYWFDQLGCSSPRVVFWRGDEDLVERTQIRFRKVLQARVDEEGYESPTGAVMNKLVRSAALAVDGAATFVSWESPEVTVVGQRGDTPLDRSAPGSGMFAFRRIDSLRDIVPLVERRDQTLSHFGFDRSELEELVRDLNGSGLDRLVPVGQALDFGRFWDGYDLLESFSRRTVLRES